MKNNLVMRVKFSKKQRMCQILRICIF